MFGRKARRIEQLEQQVEKFDAARKAAIASRDKFDEVRQQCEKYRNEEHERHNETREKYHARGKEITSLERDVKDKQTEIDGLHERLVAVPNRDMITAKAILELAQEKSDVGYDAFLKDMISSMVERGICAYDRVLGPKMMSHPDSEFKSIEEREIHYWMGFNVLDEICKPRVDIRFANFPLERLSGERDDPKNQRGALFEKYGKDEPEIRLYFRDEHDSKIRHLPSRAYRKAKDAFVPEEWANSLEEDKQVLLQAYAFGFAASYYEGINTGFKNNRKKGYGITEIDAPKFVLAMQEVAGLQDNQSLLQDLYECVAGSEKFSANVVGYFSEAS